MEKIIDRKNELNSCTVIKNILMILIVFYHTCLMFSTDKWSFDIEVNVVKPIHYIKYFLMPLLTRTFFIISGYIYAFLKIEKNQYQSYPKFILNKFLRLVVPYLFIGLCIILPLRCYCNLWTFKDGLFNILIGKSCDQLWFILSLFFIFVIVYPFDKIINKKPILSVLISAILVGLVTLLDKYDISFGLIKAIKDIPFFILGFLFRTKGTNFIKNKKTLIIGSISYLLIYSTYIILNELEFSDIAIVIYDSLFFFGAPILFGLALNLFDRWNLYDKKITKFLSKHSMNIYLLHQELIYIFILLLIEKANPYLFVFVTFISVWFISLLLSMLVRTNNVTKFLLGEKIYTKKEFIG